MDTRELFIKTVQAAPDIPEALRTNVSAVGEVRVGQMTESYLDFLDRESCRSPRGPKWEDVMRRRRAHMSVYRDVQVVDGVIRIDRRGYYVMIDPEAQAVIHWEEW